MPIESAGHLLATKFGAAHTPVASLIAQSTFLNALTLAKWGYIAKIIEEG